MIGTCMDTTCNGEPECLEFGVMDHEYKEVATVELLLDDQPFIVVTAHDALVDVPFC